MEHYSILLLVQDHGPEIPGLFLVSIFESKSNPDQPPEGPFEVAAFNGYLVSWDGEKPTLLCQYSHGESRAMPDNHAFDISKAIQDYIKNST